jgi:hypothetical protein
LIARNRALVALAKDACRWSRETAATAREARHVAKAMRDKNRAGYSAKTNAMRRQPPGDPAGKSFVISPRYVQSLQAEAAKIRARVQALVAAAKRSPPSETPD